MNQQSFATRTVPASPLRDVVVVKDQGKHTTVGAVSGAGGLLGRGSSGFLGRHLEGMGGDGIK